MIPFVTMGVLAAVLMWEVEHVGSVLTGFMIAAVAISVGVAVASGLRRKIDDLSSYYEGLLQVADEQSRQAEAANRVKDEFLATLSHELRTPLNSVLGWSRLLASGKLDGEQTRRAIQAIERAGWAQSRLIEDLLDISRIVSGRLRIETMRELLTIALQADDYLVAAVANGRQALHYLRSHAETCIILLELLLPVMDGRQFRTVQLRDRSLAWIPVIVMSAAAGVDQRARELGARSVVRKPINLDELRHAVKRVGCCPVGRLRTGLQRIPAMR